SLGTFEINLFPPAPIIATPQQSATRSLWLPICCFIMGSALITVLFISISRKWRLKHIEERLTIKEQFESHKRINKELREKVEMLYAERWQVFNSLCNEFYDKKDFESEKVRISVYKEIEKRIEDMRSRRSIKELEQLVDSYNNNLMARIRTQIPNLRNNDINFLIYLYSGFSPRAICLFTDIKIKNFYNRKSRLKDKIIASDAPDREEFASKI
ncbi:MAG: hypothetical protein K2H84_07520, partial [Paramuribaculum sp.]|nr:hypothetical protein [Paramuribaculum sp.]